MTTFKGILIKPTENSIEYVKIPKNSGGDANLEFLQQCVEGYICGVGYIKTTGNAGSFKDDFIYVNDEGLYNDEFDFVKIPGFAQEYYKGNMLIVGSDGEGGTTDVKMTVEQARNYFKSIPKENIQTRF